MGSSAVIIVIGFSLVMLSLYIYERLKNKQNQFLARIRANEDYSMLCKYNGGIYKRIDELREDVELIANRSPDLFRKCFWLYSHLRSCDEFLNEVARRNHVLPDACSIKITPREFPRVTIE